MLKSPISITALSSISALGSCEGVSHGAHQNEKHYLQQKEFDGKKVWVGALPEAEKEAIEVLRNSDAKYKNLDDSVLFAMYVSRDAIKKAGWSDGSTFGINIGSSRGATSLFEKYHQQFLETGTTPTLASPTTTLGNISTWVGHDLRTRGPVISHSITCSTALHAVLNAVAWLQSGMIDKFLVGGSEAPLTSFTIAQMQALKIYSPSKENDQRGVPEYPCRAFDLQKRQNTMVLGEAAAAACLEKGNLPNALAKIIGVGYATEPLQHNVSMSSDAQCFQDSMKMALGTISPDEVDAIVMHAPGTIKGDLSEMEAIKKTFRNKTPFLTTNKWKVGHAFGASGMLSLEMAVLMLVQQRPFAVPFVEKSAWPGKIEKILVNAVGFGANAVSVLLSRP